MELHDRIFRVPKEPLDGMHVVPGRTAGFSLYGDRDVFPVSFIRGHTDKASGTKWKQEDTIVACQVEQVNKRRMRRSVV